MASFVTNDYKLDVMPQGNYPVVYMSQFEDGRQIRFRIVNRGSSYTIPFGISAFISGLKPNGGYYEHTCEIDETRKYITVSVVEDMTDVNGRGVANITLTNGDGEKVVSAKFIVHVQATVSDNGIEIPTEAATVFQQLLDEIRSAAASIDYDIQQIEDNVAAFEATFSNVPFITAEENAEMQLPIQTINDSAISTHSTWSSNKLNTDLAAINSALALKSSKILTLIDVSSAETTVAAGAGPYITIEVPFTIMGVVGISTNSSALIPYAWYPLNEHTVAVHVRNISNAAVTATFRVWLIYEVDAADSVANS